MDLIMTYGTLIPMPVSAPGPERDLADALSQRDTLTERLEALRTNMQACRGAGRDIPANLAFDFLETERSVKAKEEELAKLEIICRDHLKQRSEEEQRQKEKAEIAHRKTVATYTAEVLTAAKQTDDALSALCAAITSLKTASQNLSLHNGIKIDGWANNPESWLMEAMGAVNTSGGKSLAQILSLHGSWNLKGSTVTSQVAGRLV